MGEHEDFLAKERARLQRAAFSRDASPEDLAALAAFERQQAGEPTEPETRTDVAEPVARPRRWMPVAAGIVLVAVVAAVVLIRPLVSPHSPNDAVPTTGPAPSMSATASSPPASSTPSSQPSQTQTPSVAVAAYSGDASCYNLVDVNTIGLFGGKGYNDQSESYARSAAADTTSPVYPFIAAHGLVCAWGRKAQSVYAYSPISSSEAKRQAEMLEADSFTRGGFADVDTYSNHAGTYLFGTGWWAYSSKKPIDVSHELVAHVPGNAGKDRTDLQSAVYVTSEGIGDLRIGKPISSRSSLVSWNPTACSTSPRPSAPWTGAWRPKPPFVDTKKGFGTIFDVVTSNGFRDGELASILIYSPEIPTKSGIRVGDSREKVEKAFPKIAASGYTLTSTHGKIHFEIGSIDPDHPDDEVVLAIFVVRAGDRMLGWGTDANGSCKA